MKTVLAIAMGALLIAAAPVKLAPADDKAPQPVGAAARAKHGPDPMTRPPADVGSAEDPVAPVSPPASTPATPLKPEPRSPRSPQ